MHPLSTFLCLTQMIIGWKGEFHGATMAGSEREKFENLKSLDHQIWHLGRL